MSDVTDNKSFGLGLTAVNEIRKSIYFMLDGIFVFFYQWFYYILYDV